MKETRSAVSSERLCYHRDVTIRQERKGSKIGSIDRDPFHLHQTAYPMTPKRMTAFDAFALEQSWN